MAHFTTKLEGIKEDDKFILKFIYYGKSAKEQPFRFFNAFKTFEARDLKIEDKKGNILIPNGRGAISPKNSDEINTSISNTKPFIYNSLAEIDEIDENTVFLNFITAAYKLKKREPYYIYLHYQDEVTDKIEVIF